MNIFLRELKANIKSLIIWGAIISLFITIATAKFASFEGNLEAVALLDSMPPAVLDALSMRSFNLTTLSGFFGVMQVYFALMGAMAAAMWGSDVIAKEERAKTVEFSLVLPVSRARLITAKALSVLVYCFAFAGITWGASLLAVQAYQPDQAFREFLALEMGAMLLIEVIFLAIGLLLGCAMRNYKRAGSTAVAIILVTYFMSVVSEINQNLDFVNFFTPFKYFEAQKLFERGSFDSTYLLLSGLITIVCVVGAYMVYQRRDLTI